MIAVLFFGLLACTSAAPRFYTPEQRYGSFSDYVLDDSIFDTNRFWKHFDTSLEHILDDFYKHFPSIVNTEGIEGNNYKIMISLPDYEEKDIIIKAREGMLMIEATRTMEYASIRSYLNFRTLPSGIDTAGSWNYNDGILTITFPLKKGNPTESSEEIVTTESSKEVVSTESITEAPREREPMEPYDKNTRENVDIESKFNSEDYLPTQMSPVEATTYAVDFNNDIEFVTVSLK